MNEPIGTSGAGREIEPGSRAIEFTTTPMLYDMMREAANVLRAELLSRVRGAATDHERRVSWDRLLQVDREVKEVDPDDRADILAAHRRWRDERSQLGNR